jgi:hypothetical protein
MSSQVWRSILEGKEVLLKGLIMRIGTGEETNIWSMNWIPRNSMLRPMENTRSDQPEFVCELIDQTRGCWDRQKLLELFHPMDVESISNIPLSTQRQRFLGMALREEGCLLGVVGLSDACVE